MLDIICIISMFVAYGVIRAIIGLIRAGRLVDHAINSDWRDL